MSDTPVETIEEVVSSPSLYLGDTTVTEIKKKSRYSNLGSGRNLKDLLQPVFFWFLKNAPEFLALLPFRLLSGLGRVLHHVPGMPKKVSGRCRVRSKN